MSSDGGELEGRTAETASYHTATSGARRDWGTDLESSDLESSDWGGESESGAGGDHVYDDENGGGAGGECGVS